MKKNIFCFFLILITALLFANTIDLFTPNDNVIKAFEKGESMSDEEFMYFAFAFSEIQEAKIPTYMQEYIEVAKKLETEIVRQSLSELEKGEYILSFLHENMYKTYREPITNLNNLFDSGVYNCVSSSIIYYALAMRFGLRVTAVQTIDHAFCSVIINGEITDVETTSPYGFNPGEKKEFVSSFGQTGFVYTPPSNYRDRTNIGKTALLSLIMQNQIVELYKTQRFDTIVHLAVNINALLQTDGSKEAMVREFRNYAAYLSKRNNYEQGIEFISSAAEQYGNMQEFYELAGSLFNNAIATELSYRTIHQLRQNLKKAISFYNSYKSYAVVPSDIIESTKKVLDEATIRVFIEDNAFEDSLEEIKNYYKHELLGQQNYNDLLMYLYSREVNILMKENKWSEALTLANRATADTINDARSKTQLQAVEHNTAAFYHNEFARNYNNQDYAIANEFLSKGLSILPNNKTLNADKKLLQEIIQ